MKRISGIRKVTHSLTLKAIRDYYFNHTNHSVAKYLMGQKVELTQEEKSDAWAIKTNLEDETYTKSFV